MPRLKASRRSEEARAKSYHPTEAVERAVVEYVDGELLTDPAELGRQMDAAIERERAAFRDPGTAAEVWVGKIAGLDRKRDAYEEEMRADGDISKERFREKIAALDEERAAAQAELAKIRESAGRVGEMERAKRAALEMFGSGL